MKTHNRNDSRLIAASVTALIFLLGISVCAGASGEDALCASVKMHVEQEVALERQAFIATMRINNGLAHIPLENMDIDILFQDESGDPVAATTDPDDDTASFFYRIDAMNGVNHIEGSGTVDPSTSAEINWLIIPVPGAADQNEMGTVYYVGASLSYTIGGTEETLNVIPDHIFVKPMPTLTLDYFLPSQVCGDDAFTPEIEPPVPFSFGVRIKNTGNGPASGLTMDYAEPKIKDNGQHLLIGFSIESGEIDGRPADGNLNIQFSELPPNTCSTARWTMTCTLSGQFVEFDAGFSHADGLGGRLTSLIDQVETHALVRDVLADAPGRDAIRDFLAKEGDAYRVYESEGVDTEVYDQTPYTSLTLVSQNGGQSEYSLAAPVTAGFMLVNLADPHNGRKNVSAVRSDGKTIKPANVWLSKKRNNNMEWEYFIHLFDSETTGSYTLMFNDGGNQPHAPVFRVIPDWEGFAGESLSFIVEADDPDGVIPALSAALLPQGASFADNGDGTGVFNWTPDPDQTGAYTITFKASDGIMETSQNATLMIRPPVDSDQDGMPDNWEMEHFGALDRDGTGDYDGDGITDLDEYLNGSDPVSSNAPSPPAIISPEDGTETVDRRPDLTVENSVDPDGEPLTYLFELYSDEFMVAQTEISPEIEEGADATSWSPSVELDDNHWFYWRVKSMDQAGSSPWTYGSFFVNTENDPPAEFIISSPANNTQADTRTPVLEISNSDDPDGDELTYGFEIFADIDMTALIASAFNIPENPDGATSWTASTVLDDNTHYFWKAWATDEHGAQTDTLLNAFFVNTANDAPEAPAILSPEDGAEITATAVKMRTGHAFDADLDELVYLFQLDTVNTFDGGDFAMSPEIPENLQSAAWFAQDLNDNTLYYWRSRASDGLAESPWTNASFFVNTANDPPPAPAVKNPGDGSTVAGVTPELEVHEVHDADLDNVSYHFELYADAALTQPIETGESEAPRWVVEGELADNVWYYWRAKAIDEHGLSSPWSESASFFTDSNGIDDPPEISIIKPAEKVYTGADIYTIAWEDEDPDSNADIALYYDTDATSFDGTLIQAEIKENMDGDADSREWDITSIPEGTWFVYAVISDGTTSVAAHAPGEIVIDRTPPEVWASPPGGTYDTFQQVVIETDETADIYYTLDDSEPTDESIRFDSPVEIRETTELKYIGVDPAGNQSMAVAETYTITLVKSGDLDTDGDVDRDDWLILIDTLFLCEHNAGFNSDADYNENGCVDIWDYIKWYKFYLEYIRERQIEVVPGDLDYDGDVDGDDYRIIRGAVGSCVGNENFIPEADYDQDGCVKHQDLWTWYSHYISWIWGG